MDLLTALANRSSIRAFKPDPVDEARLLRLLEAAGEAPSWSNTQPYLVAVANGALCEAVRKDMLAAADSRVPEGEYPIPLEYPTPLKERRQATGYGLYGVLGIERSDRPARAEQFRKNYAFFGAPVVMFLFCHEALGHYSVLDAGIWLQSLMLAATADGLGTCAQAALASYPDVVRKHFDVPAGYRLLCGLALGHPADDPVNRFRPARLPVEELLIPAR
jgi:nitroreductase